MHDLGLGGPVNVGRDENAKHTGDCFDGVYGCHLCWNAENDHRGTEAECDWCHRTDFTRVTRAIDEPVLYALCAACQNKQKAYLDELIEEYNERAETHRINKMFDRERSIK